MTPTASDLRVLYFTHIPKGYIPPLTLTPRQVVCGPFWPTERVGGTLHSLTTPRGEFDVQVVLDVLDGAGCDLLVVQVDAHKECLPRNLHRLTCRKVLLVGDTHHGPDPVQGMLSYARDEAFDCVLIQYDAHHAHWFDEAGLGNVHWLPAPNVRHFTRRLEESRRPEIVLVGQIGHLHPHRSRIVEQLQERGLPIRVVKAPPPIATHLYGHSQISLNVSLNGDLNMRVFEVLGAGGFLLTDRLTPQSGLQRLFRDGEHLVCFDSAEDLVEKATHYLRHPDQALKIARRGHQAYLDHHRPDQRRDDLLNLVLQSRQSPLFSRDFDPRAEGQHHNRAGELERRTQLYERIQAIHREGATISVAFLANVDPRMVADAVDLPRLAATFIDADQKQPPARELLARLCVSHQIRHASSCDLKGSTWDIVVASRADLAEERTLDLLAAADVRRLLLADPDGKVGPPIVTALAQIGLVVDGSDRATFKADRVTPRSGARLEVVSEQANTRIVRKRSRTEGASASKAVARPNGVRRAHDVVLSIDWDEVGQLLPRGTNGLETSGWLRSVRTGRPVNAQGDPIPWFSYPAIGFLESRVRPDWVVLEWGSGNSTLWWAHRARHVHAVEHDAQWYQELIPKLPGNVELSLATDETAYVGAAEACQGGPFDAIVIDGEARNECARAALSHVKPGGIIIFDNSDRLMYRQGVALINDHGWKRIDFFGFIPSYLYRNCTSVFYRDDSLVLSSLLPSDQVSCLGPTCSQAIGE